MDILIKENKDLVRVYDGVARTTFKFIEYDEVPEEYKKVLINVDFYGIKVFFWHKLLFTIDKTTYSGYYGNRK